jgi:multidrug efflux pump subunit AcrB
MFTPINQYHVVEEIAPAYQASTDTLERLYVRSQTSSELVPLSMLVKVQPGVSPIAIPHQGLLPAVTLTFYLAPDIRSVTRSPPSGQPRSTRACRRRSAAASRVRRKRFRAPSKASPG